MLIDANGTVNTIANGTVNTIANVTIINNKSNIIVNCINIDNGVDYDTAKSQVYVIVNDLANTIDKDLVNSLVNVYPLTNPLLSQ